MAEEEEEGKKGGRGRSARFGELASARPTQRRAQSRVHQDYKMRSEIPGSSVYARGSVEAGLAARRPSPPSSHPSSSSLPLPPFLPPRSSSPSTSEENKGLTRLMRQLHPYAAQPRLADVQPVDLLVTPDDLLREHPRTLDVVLLSQSLQLGTSFGPSRFELHQPSEGLKVSSC